MNRGPRREPRLRDYDYTQTGAYFVTICTRNRARLFGEVVGGDVLIAPWVRLSEWGEHVERVILQIPAVREYVIMPDHVHLIVVLRSSGEGSMSTSTPTGGLPSLVRFLKRQATMLCGQPIWQRNYYEHVIRGSDDYLDIQDYIKNNPARWMDRTLPPGKY